ncbi:MAG TPA: aquaporin, partial [Candidatus Limnocylindrales bacterium]|nr:aquaporin [Candidatus Limnocylindrales bacterium]
MDARKYLAELIGTFILVAVGSLSIAAAVAMQVPVLIVVPFGFGLGLLAAIQTAGHVSGGHFNPAVTLGALLDRRIEPMNALGYWVAQVVGAIAASGVVLFVAGQDAVNATASGFPDGRMGQAIVVEAILTAIFL